MPPYPPRRRGSFSWAVEGVIGAHHVSEDECITCGRNGQHYRSRGTVELVNADAIKFELEESDGGAGQGEVEDGFLGKGVDAILPPKGIG